VDVENVVPLELRLERVQPALVRAEAGVPLRKSLQDFGPVRRRLAEPALAVAADPGRVRKLAQPLDRLTRPRRPRREVPTEEISVGSRRFRILQNLFQGDQVAVDVVQHSEHR
jgi:hypothetical protein